MAKPNDVLSGDTFLTWRSAFNALKAIVPETITSPSSAPTASDDGYDVLSLWLKEDTQSAWILVFTTGSNDAVWTSLGPSTTATSAAGDFDLMGYELTDSTGTINIGEVQYATLGEIEFIEMVAYDVDAGVYITADSGGPEFSALGMYANATYTPDANNHLTASITGNTNLSTSGRLRLNAPYILLQATDVLQLNYNGDCHIYVEPGKLNGRDVYFVTQNGGQVLYNGVEMATVTDVADQIVDNAHLADMNSWTIKMRNNASSGDPEDVTISSLTEEAAPAAGDFLLGEESGGTLRKFDVGNLQTDSRALTSEPGSDHSVSGTTAQMEVGESVTFGQVLYMHTDGKLWEAEADNANEIVFAMAAESITANNTGTVLLYGFARDDSWNWTPGNVLYNSTAVGAMTATAPSTTGDRVQVCARATHADRVFFNPSPDHIIVK